MTCIAGIIAYTVLNPESPRPTVTLGADSLGSAGWDCTVRTDSKLISLGNGRMILGGSGSYRAIQLIRHGFTLPDHPVGMPTEEYLVTCFIEAMRERFKAGGFMKKENERESGSFFLVGYQGRLFRISEDYQVGESSHGFDAIGCGDTYALGSLHSTARNAELSERQRLTLALEAAEEFSNGVRRPFEFSCLMQEAEKQAIYRQPT